MLYIMRHGKTDWNTIRKLQGRTDIELNELGREMAQKARNEYKDVHFDVCYCSPLVRAKETAEIVLEGRNIPIITDERLVEMSFGVCEGVIIDLNDSNCPMKAFFQEPDKYVAVKNAESMEDLFLRTGNFLKEVIEPQIKNGKDILIVGHGAMNSSIVCQVKNLPLKDFWSAGLENCKLLKLI